MRALYVDFSARFVFLYFNSNGFLIGLGDGEDEIEIFFTTMYVRSIFSDYFFMCTLKLIFGKQARSNRCQIDSSHAIFNRNNVVGDESS